MNPIRFLAVPFVAFAITSCASHKRADYDTPADAVNAPVNPPSNPVYDTPAAYEESGTTAAAPAGNVQAPVNPGTIPAPVPAAPKNGAALIHTVVAGDTLGGIALKYKVSAAAIKQANGMTKDTVVLGRKMVIPPAR